MIETGIWLVIAFLSTIIILYETNKRYDAALIIELVILVLWGLIFAVTK